MRLAILAAPCLILIETAAIAGASVRYAPYEGPPAIRTGEGGTKISKNGIDYWNTGAPARRYQIIGVITDKRYEEWGDGSAIGSAKVARMVIKMGGNAVMVSNESSQGGGSSYGVPITGGGFIGLGMDRTVTQLLVIKYLAP